MKKNKLLFIATFSAACLLSLVSCQGAQGPKGDQGEPGINGTNGTDGKNGENGEDGNSVRTGKGVPASTLGKDGDSYIDIETFDFYVKADGKWSKEGNIKGASGDAGSEGEDGTSIRNGKGVPVDTLGNDGDCYIDLSTFDFYVKADGKWSKEGNIKGEKGEQGEKGDKGTSGSTGSKGDDGKPGETAWSNTILHSTGGYVVPSVGSALATKEISFKIYVDGGYTLDSVSLNSNTYTTTSSDYKINYSSEGYYYIDTTMVAGGYVVKANFSAISSSATVMNINTGKTYITLEESLSDEDDGGTYKLLKDSSFKYQDGKTADTYAIVKKNFIIDLNEHNLTSTAVMNLGYGLEKFSIIGSGNVTFNIDSSNAYAINVGTASDTVTPEITIGKDVVMNANGINGIYVKNEIFKENGKNYTDAGKPDATLGDYQIKAKVDIYGKITSTANTALKVEGKQFIRASQNIQANIYSGAELTSTGNAIELSDGTLNVEGGTIKGETALSAEFSNKNSYDEQSGTTINLTDGTFTSTEGASGTAIRISYGVKYEISDAVKTNKTGSINIGYLETSTADEFVSALNSSFNYIYLTQDVTLNLTDDLSFNTNVKVVYCRGHNLTINLNGHNIKSTKDFVIADAAKVEILNESTEKSTITKNLILVNSNSATVKNVKFDEGYTSNLAGSYAKANSLDQNRTCVFDFENVDFEGSMGFTTYGGYDNYSKYTFNFKKCNFKGTGNNNNNAGCVIDGWLCTANFTECEFTGDRQCLIVRGGTATVTDCSFKYTGLYKTAVSKWSYDNAVANAMIVVGNNSDTSLYYNSASLTFVDTQDKGNKFNISDENTNNSIYVVNNGTYNVAVNMTSAVSDALSEKAYVADNTGTATTTIKVGETTQTIENNKWKEPQD